MPTETPPPAPPNAPAAPARVPPPPPPLPKPDATLTVPPSPKPPPAPAKPGVGLNKLAEDMVTKANSTAPQNKPSEPSKPPVDTKTPPEPSKPPTSPFDALQGHLEKAGEPPIGVKPEPGKPDDKPADEPTVESVLAEGEALRKDPHLPQRTEKALERHRVVIKNQQALLDAKEKALEEARKEAEAAKTAPAAKPEEVENLQKELAMYRWRENASADPEVKAKYDDVISHHNDTILSILGTLGLNQQNIEAIKSLGGFGELESKNPEFVSSIRDALQFGVKDDSGRMISPPQPQVLRKIDTLLGQIETLREQKNIFIKQGEAKALDWFKQKEQQAAQQNQGKQALSAETAKAIENYKAELYSKHPIFSKYTLPADATEAQKKEAKSVEQGQASLKTIIEKVFGGGPKETSTLVNFALDGLVAKQQIAILQQNHTREIEDLKAQLETAKKALPGNPGSRVNPTRREDATGEPKTTFTPAGANPRAGISSIRTSMDAAAAAVFEAGRKE